MQNIIYLIIILLIILFYFNYVNTYEQFDGKIKLADIKIDENILITIREILKKVDEIFGNHDIQYWADCGTLLGMIRHQNIIPWDDDGDISIMKHDEYKFLKLKPLFENAGYEISSWWGGYKIYPKNGKHMEEFWQGRIYKYKYPSVDIFIMDYNQDKSIVHYHNSNLRKLWPKEYYFTKYLFPLKKYKFADFSLWGPAYPEEYLNRVYGNDWLTVAYLQYDHKNMKMHKKRKFKLTDVV